MRVTWKEANHLDAAIIGQGQDHPLTHGWIDADMDLRVGEIIEDSNCRVQLENRIRLCREDGLFMPAWIVRKDKGALTPGEDSCVRSRTGFSLAWITLSDKGSRGERVDASGPAIRDAAMGSMEISLARGMIIPDEPEILKSALVDCCLFQGFDLVFTSGGTGVGPRDITPEVTLPLLDKRLPGFERAMTQTSLAKTPHAMISRAVAGIMGFSLVVNLPGSPKAVRENLHAILPALKHAVEKLQGDQRDCGQ
ncbi:MAG: MogA/MoaB family molybdenum cofactor biosynthesis protein [Desulfomicrobium sp.]|nr:MogA/MoaB family molybdenum cofactor biosynthesis protein [Desulfomicrobium sp.]